MTTNYRFKNKEQSEEKFLLVYVGSHVFKLEFEFSKGGLIYVPLSEVQKMLAAMRKKYPGDISIYRHTDHKNIEILCVGD